MPATFSRTLRSLEADHLRAAREVWRYSVDSARTIFSEKERNGPASGR